MSVNLFFALVLGALIGMLVYFKPLESVAREGGEVPQFELESFVIYEVSKSGIDHFFEGKEGKRFENRYEVSMAKFSDNSKSLFETIRSDSAVYQEDVISLKGNVHYAREDGLQFRSNEGKYDKNNDLVSTDGDFTITQKSHSVHGTSLNFNTKYDTVEADAIRGSYQLD